MTIRVVSDTGSRVLIGSISAGGKQVLFFGQPSYNGSYRLEAESRGQSQVTSQPFPLARGDQLLWVLRENTVRFTTD